MLATRRTLATRSTLVHRERRDDGDDAFDDDRDTSAEDVRERDRARRRRWNRVVLPILAAPMLVLTGYAMVRFWPIDDDEASQQRHSFIESDGNADLPTEPPTIDWNSGSRLSM